MAGLDASGHTEIERPQPRPKAAPREDVPTVRPFRPAAAGDAPVNNPKPPQAAQPSLAERIGGLAPSAVEEEPPPPPPSSPAPAQSAADTYGLNPAQVAPASAVPSRTPVTVDNDPVIRNLISVGMPEAMANQITGGDTYAGVLSVLAARPSAPGIPDGPGEILVGERTVAVLPGHESSFEELPPVRLKGKPHPVPLFRALW